MPLWRTKWDIRHRTLAHAGTRARLEGLRLVLVFQWPLICLKSPKQQKGEAAFYCASMRKEGDRANLAWWMGSNWVSKPRDKGAGSRHKTSRPRTPPAEFVSGYRESQWVIAVIHTLLQSSAAEWKSGWSDKYLKQGAIRFPLISANAVEWRDHISQRRIRQLRSQLYTKAVWTWLPVQTSSEEAAQV